MLLKLITLNTIQQLSKKIVKKFELLHIIAGRVPLVLGKQKQSRLVISGTPKWTQ
jgi:hypothetical protein